MSLFNGATLMITGGTGSFGNTVLKHFLTSDIEEIRISIYSKGNYLSLKKSIEKKLINGDITITDRR